MQKPIRFSRHALDQMKLRSATQSEVIQAVETTAWQTAKRGKNEVRKNFPFGQPSPVNNTVYAFRTVHVIFADEPTEVVIVTVLVYYGN
ncbi:MAG: DUF4258 domain-containing protein [Anaerolineae bacterium]|nr:DUF4258 domain-containing protein [Anaerolineae bacterium]